MAIVYRHRRLDNNEIFYIGIGNFEDRAYNKKGRSEWWRKIIKKTEYQVEIISKDLIWEDACELEILLISEYGRRDLGLGTLVNLTDGGDGQSNPSQESRLKMRGNKMNVRGENHHFYGVPKTEEHKQKLREAKLGGKHTQEHIDKVIESNKKFNESNKYVICSRTLKTWGTIKKCAEEIDIQPKTLRAYLSKGKVKNVTSIMYYKDYIAFGVIEPHIKTKHLMQAMNLTTLKIYNVLEISEELLMKPSSIRGKLKRNTLKGFKLI